MADKQVNVDRTAQVEAQSVDGARELANDLAYQRLLLVNVAYFGIASETDRAWVVIDAGVPGSTNAILRAAASRFGESSRPVAIVLTHGHFDHVGALEELLERWDVPVFAHELECPYLDGSAAYPAPDPSVGGGMMATLSRFYPRGPINVGSRLRPLSADGSVPGMPGWRWIHAPGHTPGQVAFWRGSDRTLLAADAFITTKQESAYAVMTQRPELHGPPMYYTQDWDAARETVRRLSALEPELVLTGHGPPMQGTEMRAALQTLAARFDLVALPKHGRYVDRPASVDRGTAYEPPR